MTSPRVIVVVVLAAFLCDPVFAQMEPLKMLEQFEILAADHPMLNPERFPEIQTPNPKKSAPNMFRLVTQTSNMVLRRMGLFFEGPGSDMWSHFHDILKPVLVLAGAPKEVLPLADLPPAQLFPILCSFIPQVEQRPVATNQNGTISAVATSFIQVTDDKVKEPGMGLGLSGMYSLSVASSWAIFVVLILSVSFWVFLLAAHTFSDIFSEGLKRLPQQKLERQCTGLDPYICTGNRLVLLMLLLSFMILYTALIFMSFARLYTVFIVRSPKPGAIDPAKCDAACRARENGEDPDEEPSGAANVLDAAAEAVENTVIESTEGTVTTPSGTVSTDPSIPVAERDVYQGDSSVQGNSLDSGPGVPATSKNRSYGTLRALGEIALVLVTVLISLLMIVCTIAWTAISFYMVPTRFMGVTCDAHGKAACA